MIDSQKIGERLEDVADEFFDGNKNELARYLGKDPNSFYKYFKGKRTPGLDIAAQLGRLGVNVNWFITGRGDMKTTSVVVEDSNLAAEMAEEYNHSKENDIFSAVEWGDLSSAEAHLLEEVKQLSAFLESRETLRPQVKRLLIELLIQSIDRAIEPPRRDPDDS